MIVASSRFSGLLRFLRARRIPVLFVVLAAIVLPQVTVYFARDSRGADINGYIAAGEAALRLDNLYANSSFAHNNTWPPFFSFAVIPLAWSARALGKPWTKELWYAFNFLCLVGAILLWSRLLLKTPVSFVSRTRTDFTDPRVFWPVVFVLPGIISNFFMLQINACILLLVTLGLYLFTRRRLWQGALFIALAASMKVVPGLLLVYFLLRRQWRFGAWMAFWGALFTLSPAIAYGTDAFAKLFTSWLSISSPAHAIIGYGKANNQSLYAATERLLAHQLGIVPAGSTVISIVAGLTGLALLAGSLAVFMRRKYECGTAAALLEFSSMCLLMVLLSPIAWGHYWVLAYPASATVFIVLCANPQYRRIRTIRYLMVAWIALLLLPFIAGGSVGFWFRRFSSSTWSAITLNALVLALHARLGVAVAPAREIGPG
jgi:hypothetical protein